MYQPKVLAYAFTFSMLGLALTANAGEQSDSKVKVTAKALKSKSPDKLIVYITVEIETGWYIYANPVGSPAFKFDQTRVTIAGKKKVDANVVYPPGIVKEFAGNLKMNVYEKGATIEALVATTPGDTSPLEITIHVNAFNKDKALLPGTVKLTVPTPK